MRENTGQSVLPVLFISLISLAVFVAGAVLLFSGALPAAPGRLWMSGVCLPLLELSHFVAAW
jgi:lysylphosphatidylglycerol synthetase-like protein (DUF2156 family)